MRKALLFIVLICTNINLVYSKRDSIATPNLQQKAEALVESVFKPSPELNNADSLIKVFDDLPSFGIYKNNYIITGTTINHRPTRDNSDAKFQISVSQMLTNSVLPFRTYLFLTYTQLAFWNIYQESFPFGDINFNPTIGLGKALVYKNRFLGSAMFHIEHESNGKDGDLSRSWNKVSISAILKLDKNWTIQPKAWIPIIDGEGNRDIVKYKGWGFIGVDYNKNNKYNIGLLVTKRGGINLNANISATFAYRVFEKDNQYLFLEYFNGYGESLLDYNQHRHRIRLGFVIKPNFMHAY